MCCGRQRRQISQEAGAAPRGGHARLRMARGAPAARPAGAYFEYVGPTGMTAVGPATGRRYRFASHGAVAVVDPRDAKSLAAVPRLRRLT